MESNQENEESSNDQPVDERSTVTDEAANIEQESANEIHVNSIERPEQLENTEESSFVTIAVQPNDDDDQNGEQVYSYLDTSSATLFVQNQFNGASPRLFITQSEDGNEFIVVVSEDGQSIEQSFPPNTIQQDVILENAQRPEVNEASCEPVQCGSAKNDKADIHSNNNSRTDCAGEESDVSETAVWAIRDNVPGQESNTEMVFIPTQSIMSSQLLADDDSSHRNVVNLSPMPQESSNMSMVSLNNPPEVARNISENSVIVTKHFSDVDSPSQLEKSGHDEEIDNPLTVDEGTNDHIVQEPNQTGSQYSPYSGSRAIDNAVSVIHSPSSYNSLNGNGLISLKNREMEERKDYNHEEESHLEDSYPENSSPEQAFHLTSSNKLLIDEDSNTMSSQTSGLDLSKDSKVQYSIPGCDSQLSEEDLKIIPESLLPQNRMDEDSDVSIDHISSKHLLS